MRALRMSAVTRPLTVTSTPMYSAAWARATCIAASVPSSSEVAPSRAPEKYSVSPSCGTFTSQPGVFGDEAVLTTAGASAAQAASSITAPSAARAPRVAVLLRTTHHRGGGLLGDPLRLVLQAPDVVQLAQHVLVVRQLVRLLHGGGRAIVVAGVLVGEAQVPVRLGELLALDLGVLLPVGDRLGEGRLRLLPLAAFRPADAALELRDVGVLLEARGHVFLVRNDGAQEALQHPAPLLVRLGDDQPAGGHVDDLEGRARADLAAQLVDDGDGAVLVLDAVLGRNLAVLLIDVAVDEGARGHHLAELRGLARIGQVAGGERQLAHDRVHVLPVEDLEAVGAEQRLLQRVAHDGVAAAAHLAHRDALVGDHVDLGGAHDRHPHRHGSTG